MRGACRTKPAPTIQATPSVQGWPQLPQPKESRKPQNKHSGDGVVTRINGTFGYLIANWPAFHSSSFKSDSRLEAAIGQLLVGIM